MEQLKQMHSSCLRCGRPLRSKQSAERGYGPVCAKKAKEDPNLIDLLQPSRDEQNFMDELQEQRKVKAG